MINGYVLDKVLNIVKERITIEKLDDAKSLTDADDKLPDYITLKNVGISIARTIKHNDEFYPQMFLEKPLHDK